MKYNSAASFRTALEQRLNTQSQETGAPLMRFRKLVVFDRLMARLLVVAPSRWILKGGVALHFRVGTQFRTTKDLDLGREDNQEAATADFLSAQSVDLGDHFTFVIERTEQLDSANESNTVRYHVTAQIAGRTFEEITVDVGFGEQIFAEPEALRGPELLTFADITPVEVPALPLADHIAEKLHAYTRDYPGGKPSTRVKDLIDLAIISSLFSMNASRLRKSMESTFTPRATHPLPEEFPLPPSDWRVPYQRMAEEVDLEPDFKGGYELVRAFLDPILATACQDEGEWDPTTGSWHW